MQNSFQPIPVIRHRRPRTSAFVPLLPRALNCYSQPKCICETQNGDRKQPPHSAAASTSTTTSCGIGILAGLVIASLTLHPIQTHALGVGDGLLDNCQPARISCVSSQDDTPTSFLEPWEYEEELPSLQERLVAAIMLEPRASLVARQPRYLRFEIPTNIPKLVDDLEFFFPPLDNVVHFRSSRRDRSFDFLLNRRRLDRLRLKVGLAQITVLRNRISALSIFESPFDAFGPSAVDVDAIIDRRGIGSRVVR